MPEINQPLVYILECNDGTLYTGWTVNLPRRLATHNAGRGARYTRTRLPVRVVYTEPQPDRPAALRRERALKKLSRAQKLALISQFQATSCPAAQASAPTPSAE